ncbi:nucleoside diphosphate kinase regulator [Saccharospirillum salsuginis]|uniref:Nucleoside diphosphate kinase regulator n=1 Tax=Saccharospirillum salsuginis TaxID=418750 RepID=A0A918N686_9GAMM|nr:nucleoside diphosphate kinase regulator [Saccharospirillum salsuginis]GGX41843.1 nucleoside diphosphate kinase regulator [Saccharospirillum salsuginis]
MDIEFVISSLDCERLESLIDSAPATVQRNTVELQKKLANATIVPPSSVPGDVVSMNSVVEFELIDSGEPFEMTLVYPREVNGTQSTLSVFAPIGTALLGCRRDAEVSFDHGNGKTSRIRVINIYYQPESSGDMHR